MGPIFTGRPAAQNIGEQCSMCLDPHPSDTAVIDSKGRTRYICVAHELMLARAFDADETGLIAVDHYQAHVLKAVLQDAEQPAWMPAFMYRRLIARADAKARLLAIITVLGMGNPLTYANPSN